jgi:hypothetical protein
MHPVKKGEITLRRHNKMTEKIPYTNTFGRTGVPRCQARSKRSGEQCRKAAMKGKQVCRTHGGRSTGPKTAAGRAKCADAKMVHGWETRALREARAVKLRELRELEKLMVGMGMIQKASHRR